MNRRIKATSQSSGHLSPNNSDDSVQQVQPSCPPTCPPQPQLQFGAKPLFTSPAAAKQFNFRTFVKLSVRKCLRQKLEPLVLVLLIPICVWINSVALSPSASSSWRRKYRDAPFRPRMIQLDQATNLLDITRLQFQYELQSFKHRQNMLMYWDNNGPLVSHKPPDDMKTRDTCIYTSSWQLAHHPSCNAIHEVDMVSPLVSFVNQGAYRDVWTIPDGQQQQHRESATYRVLKTLRFMERREFDLRNFDRHRRDALAFSELQASPHVMDIYGHCANSALFDYMDGGDLSEFFENDNNHKKNKRKPTQLRILQIAYTVAASVADAHHFDRNGRPTIAHTDIKPDQWLLGRDGNYRLGDFNRARFLMWDTQEEEVCPFEVGKNGGIWRSPEEYRYDNQTEKGDVWSLGNVLYFLLSGGLTPMEHMDYDEAIKFVKNGGHPISTEYFKLVHDDFTDILGHAMMSCFVLDPKKRPGARKIANLLRQGVQKLSLKERKK